METSLFWDAQQNEDGTLDRVYNPDDFAAMFMGFWGDGLIPNVSTALLVEPIENSFAVVVNPGDAFIKGRFCQNTEDRQFTLSNGNAEERVDYIALRFDLDAIVSSFESWYTDMRELLDEDIAVQLQNEIDELETKHDSDVARSTSR